MDKTPSTHQQRQSPASNRSLWLIFEITVLALLATGRVELSTAATLPAGFTESLVTSGLSSPTAMEFAPDGRLFVCQQGGQLRVIKDGVLLSTPFLSVTTDSSGERGLLGIAFDPKFAVNHWLYIYYTVPGSPAHNRVSRFTANGDVVVAGSEVVLLDLDSLSTATNHNGGAIHFGPDGKLYVGVGENANSANAQSLANRLGKILRVNSDGTIPTDNPLLSVTTGANGAIWALGLRNPFTFAFEPGTGRMCINDVGNNTWEEIDEGVAGANYGWPTCEGACSPSNPSYVDPLTQYGHTGACATTGGTFYNPAVAQFPAAYQGKYFFADYCGGWIHTLDLANANQVADFATGLSAPVDLKVSTDGSLYYLDRGRSSVYRVSYPAAATVTLTLDSSPMGLTLALDGNVVNSPYFFQSAPGSGHTISASSSVRIGKVNYTFSSWSDGGAQTHSILTPSSDTSYVAVYVKKSGRH
jgi:glucose/arabinose dehydrogenase